MYTMLPFGLNNTGRVVTKILRPPLIRWRSWGARATEVHTDDGCVFAQGQSHTLHHSRRVRQDLTDFGLLIAEDKCSWGARRRLEWIGLIWDTVQFKMVVPELKIARTIRVIIELLQKKKMMIAIKEIVGCCGLLTSLRPALRDILRFRTR